MLLHGVVTVYFSIKLFGNSFRPFRSSTLNINGMIRYRYGEAWLTILGLCTFANECNPFSIFSRKYSNTIDELWGKLILYGNSDCILN